MAQPLAAAEGRIRGEVEGEGIPTVLLHGLTATRAQVVHGSRVLPRKGHRTVLYDARGHGESAPAPPGEGYGYPQLVSDLEEVVREAGAPPRVVLAGHSMGAHTAIAFALAHPDRVAALVVVGPVYPGRLEEDSMDGWDTLAAALEERGVDGFVAAIEAQGLDPEWRESILGFTRRRMEAHRHLGAVATALREVPRSRPFGGIGELEGLEVPALVVASHDDADPGHPYEVARLYAERLPLARLVSEEQGASPLAWQGGRLSREIVSFCAEPAVAARLA